MESLIERIVRANASINDFIWGAPMLILIVGTGVYFSFCSGFFQFRSFPHMLRHTLLKRKRTTEKGALTPFQAMTTALAATVGTGNIAGVAGAIALGGPGAVFWMWISSLFSMATKYAEVLLAIRFRTRNEKGDWVGGPMYYIVRGLGKNWRLLASLFALFGALASFGIGNMVQANTIADALQDTILTLLPDMQASAASIRLIAGITIALLSAIVILGGMRRVGRATEMLVPFMSLVYILGALVLLLANLEKLPTTLALILKSAFCPQAVLGGAGGVTMISSMRRGIGRGVFSNEAGLGSAPIAHAASSETNAVRQGLYGIFEVFADTILICTLTALSILSSGVYIPYGENAGVTLSIEAFSSVLGNTAGSALITLCIILFAISTIFSWSLYGARCLEFLFGVKSVKPYQCVFILFVALGGVMRLDLVWSIADTLNGLMAIPNLIALLALSGVVARLTRQYRTDMRKKKKL